VAFAGWELYDDFNSGVINSQKWFVDDSSANISIENGEVKFFHKPGYPMDRSWLKIVDNPQSIIGIRTNIRVQSCTGDVHGRIGGWVGKIGEKELWSSMDVRADEGSIRMWVGHDTSSLEWLNLFGGGFNYITENPLNIIGKTFTIEWMFTPEKIVGKTDSYGEMVFKYPDKVLPPESSEKAIGTRSVDGMGPCVIYFDNVYVYRKTPSAATNLLLLEE
jgi:hypothetical protein